MENSDLDRIPTSTKIVERYSGRVVLEVENDPDDQKTLREIMEENRGGFPTSRYYYLGE